MIPGNPSRLAFVPALNGLRGAAVLAVMLFHAGAPFLRGGFIGVDIFFVLSGFLITSILVLEYNGAASIRLMRFYARRVLRLIPALLLLLASAVVFSLVTFTAGVTKSILAEAAVVLFYGMNWVMAFALMHPSLLLAHTWSLAIEEQFYILWPAALSVALRRARDRRTVLWLAVLLALLSWGLRAGMTALGTGAGRLYYGLDTRADGLMTGCALGIAWASGMLEGKTKRILALCLHLLAPLGAACLLFMAVRLRWEEPRFFNWALFAIQASVAVLILDVFVNEKGMLRRVLSVKWLVWVGSISYGLYLWHYPIYQLLIMMRFTGLPLFFIGTPAIFLAASASYYFMEKPILRMKERFSAGPPEAQVKDSLRKKGLMVAG